MTRKVVYVQPYNQQGSTDAPLLLFLLTDAEVFKYILKYSII